MIGTIRRHQKWLWICIVALTIFTFVPFVANTPKLNRGDNQPSMNLGSVNGAPITVEQYRRAKNDEALFYFFHYGAWPSDDNMRRNRFDMESRIYQRILFNEKIRELKIDVTPVAEARMIKEMFGLKPNEAVPKDKYQRLIVSELGSQGFSHADFELFIKDQVAQQHLITLFGMSGKMITAKEAESFWKRENEPIVAQLVRFPASEQEKNVSPKPEDLQNFFKAREQQYWLPERVQVNYLKFDKTNYLADADKELAGMTNLTQIINQIYSSQDPKNFKDEKGNQMSEADAKVDLKKRMREEAAGRIALSKAREFLNDLHKGHDDSNPFKADDMEKLASAKGLSVKTTDLFDARTGPKGLDVSRRFVELAFALKDNDPDDKSKSMLYSSAIEAQDGAYVLGFKQHVQTQPQKFEAVREEVAQDYKREKSAELARAAGQKFQAAVTNGLASGKSFEAICTEQNVKATSLPPFSLSSTNIAGISDARETEQIQSIAFNVPTGKASSFVPTMEGGFMIYVKERQAIDPAKMQAEMPAYLARMREQRQMAAFNDWFQKQWAEQMRMPDRKNEKPS